jgi:type VI secretion system protein ImpF
MISPMASASTRDRLQPSLFDRLEDDLGPAIEQLRDIVRVLNDKLDSIQLPALHALLADERLLSRPPTAAELAPFEALAGDLRALVDEAIRLERYRRLELQRVFVIAELRLRETCLHDLQCLFNETSGSSMLPDELLAELPSVCSSVLNYGLPAIAGTLRTPDQFALLARDIERAIVVFEPRIRNARVSIDQQAGRSGVDGSERAGYIIDGELWGYPFDEQLRIRTLLDLDLGRLNVVTSPPGART